MKRKLIFTLKKFDFADEEGGILGRLKSTYPFAQTIIEFAGLLRGTGLLKGRLFELNFSKLLENKFPNRIIMEALTLPMLKDRQTQLGKICCGLLGEGKFEKVKRILTMIDPGEIRGVIKETCMFCAISGRNELIPEIFRCSLTEEDEKVQVFYEAVSDFIKIYKNNLCRKYEGHIKGYGERIETDEQSIKIYEKDIVEYARKAMNVMIIFAIQIASLDDRCLWIERVYKDAHEAFLSVHGYEGASEFGRRILVKDACKFCVKQKRNELIAEIFRCSLTKEDERAEILYEAASELIIGYTDMISDNYEARIKVYEERIQTDDQYIDMGIDMGEEYMKIYEEAIVDYARNTVYKLVDIAIEIAKLDDCRLWRERIYRDAHEAFWRMHDYERASTVGQLISQTESV